MLLFLHKLKMSSWVLIGFHSIGWRQQAKEKGVKYSPETYSNEDTEKQLLIRSRYSLFKSPNNWSDSQKIRMKILFEKYPDIKIAYDLAQDLKRIYSHTKDKTRIYKASTLV